MKADKHFFCLVILITAFTSCKNHVDKQPAEETSKVQVSTTPVELGNISDFVLLNGRTVILGKSLVISPIGGYVKSISVQLGDVVNANDLLFEIQTRESKILENITPDTNTITGQRGISKVLSPATGLVSELNINTSGLYVTEGSQLCTIISNRASIVQVNVPFNEIKWLKVGQLCNIKLPDSTYLEGNISKIMPVIDESAQTQNVLINLMSNRPLPENMNVVVKLLRSVHKDVMLIPKTALFTNETQQQFWVMKLDHDSVAVKIPVSKGLEEGNKVEISASALSAKDILITEGGYELPDNAIVKVQK